MCDKDNSYSTIDTRSLGNRRSRIVAPCRFIPSKQPSIPPRRNGSGIRKETADAPPKKPPHAPGSRTPKASERSRVKVNQRLLVLHVTKVARRGLPTPFLGFGAGRFAHLGAKLRIAEQLQFFHKLVGVSRFHEVAVHTVVDEVGDATSSSAHHRHTGRHALQDHKAKRFGIRRHNKDIGRSKRLTQFISSELTRENSVGTRKEFFEFLLLGSLPHNGQSRVGSQFLQNGLDIFQSLFRTESSHINH